MRRLVVTRSFWCQHARHARHGLRIDKNVDTMSIADHLPAQSSIPVANILLAQLRSPSADWARGTGILSGEAHGRCLKRKQRRSRGCWMSEAEMHHDRRCAEADPPSMRIHWAGQQPDYGSASETASPDLAQGLCQHARRALMTSYEEGE